MNGGRNQPKKPGFDLSKFYQDLSRVQSSLGKPAPRKSTNSVNKYANPNKQQQDRVQTLQSFKKELNNKNLVKGKIHIQQNYQKPKISKTQNQQKNNQSRIYRLSQNQKEQREDPWQDIRGKFQTWDAFQKDSKLKKSQQYQPSFIKTVNNSQFYFDRKDDNIYQNLQISTEIPINQQNQNPTASTVSKSLLDELQKRNRVYRIVERGVKLQRSYYKKEAVDLSIRLKQNLRQGELMKEIIEQFKEICGLKISDLGKLYEVLKSNSSQSQGQRSFSRDMSGLSQK